MTIVEPTPTVADAGWMDQWRRWRADRERDLRDPHGWLSLTGLHWLDAQPLAVDGLPGRWSAGASSVAVRAEAADGLLLHGEPIDGTIQVEPVDGAPGPRVAVGDVRIELIRRGGRFALRVRDPRSATLARFTGVPTFPAEAGWILSGRFEPYDGPRPVTVGSVVDGLTHTLAARGIVRSSCNGTEFALTAFGSGDDLRLTFRDATSGVTTYAAARSLTVPAPDADARVGLDFNRAVNLPCAFTEYATCPLPPPENVLPFAVEAGEKTPR
jgi:uncharacterized protein (DUF1684 family)